MTYDTILFSLVVLCYTVTFNSRSFTETNQRPKKRTPPSLRNTIKRWTLNHHQLVQTKNNQRLTFRQTGGKSYRGITLTPSQFWEFDKVIQRLSESYLTQALGQGIHFTQPRQNVYTLWKESKSNPKVDTAFFRFDEDSWLQYIRSVHDEMKSVLCANAQE